MTKFFLAGHDDFREEGPSTPEWMGQAFVRTQEFYDCQSGKLAELLGVSAKKDVQWIRKRFRAHKDFEQMVGDVVVRRRRRP